MKDNTYLYGEDVEVPDLDRYAVMRRIELLKEHLVLLYEPHYTKRDDTRIRKVDNAVKFWEEMLKMN